MGKFVVIGGGELSKGETYRIDQEIVRLAGKERPKTLFIPTASYESEGYCQRFKNLYENQLGAEVDILFLLDDKLSVQEIESKIKWAEVIYVGGGDTVNMLSVWRKKQVDVFLKNAYKEGTLLCGLSAGSICWFEYGQSEIECDTTEDGFEYIKLEALGFIKACHCPHFNEGRREVEFYKMIKVTDLVGIALDNNCALILIDNQYRIIKADSLGKAYKVSVSNDKIVKEEIIEDGSFRTIDELGISLLK